MYPDFASGILRLAQEPSNVLVGILGHKDFRQVNGFLGYIESDMIQVINSAVYEPEARSSSPQKGSLGGS